MMYRDCWDGLSNLFVEEMDFAMAQQSMEDQKLLDLTELRPEDARVIRELYHFLKTRPVEKDLSTNIASVEYLRCSLGTREAIRRKVIYEEEAGGVVYHAWDLGVKEPLTRRKIYDDL